MEQLTMYWILFMVGAFITMFVIIPPELGPRLSPVGFWMGLVQAVFWLWLGQINFKVFNLPGDPTLFGIPIIASISWIPAVILFTYYFLQTHDVVKRIALVLLFAGGAVFVQYVLQLAGMWENQNWNLFYTFILATITHTIISAYLLFSKRDLTLH